MDLISKINAAFKRVSKEFKDSTGNPHEVRIFSGGVQAARFVADGRIIFFKRN